MNEMQSLRVLSHGKITDLSNGFKLPGNVAFSVYVRPKEDTLANDVLLNCRCTCDDEVSALPVPLYNWTPAAIMEIAPDAISLEDYDVFWGAGNPKI